MPRATKGTATNLAHWLKRQNPATYEKGELRLITRGVGEAEVVSRWPGSMAAHPEDLATDIVEVATAHCDLMQTETAYTVQLVAVDGDAESVQASLPMRRKPADPSTTEEASMQGFVTQLMRHKEALVRMMLASQKETINQSLRLSEMALARVDKLEAERGQLLEDSADAVHAAQIDEVAAKRAEIENRRSQKLENLLEAIAAKALKESNL